MSWLDSAPELLEITGTALRTELLPALPPERRYQGAMVGNALAISLRALRLGAAASEAEREGLLGLLGDQESGLGALRARLCREIRAGLHDGERSAALRAHLREAVRQRLAISNPEHLARYGG